MKAKEDELRKVFQSTVSLCVHRGLMTSERAQSYYRSGETYELYVCVCGFWLNVEVWLHFFLCCAASLQPSTQICDLLWTTVPAMTSSDAAWFTSTRLSTRKETERADRCTHSRSQK